jgi:dethiobiotin synthetase
MSYTMAAPAIRRAPDGRSACADMANLVSNQEVKWTWSCRTLKPDRHYHLLGHESATPRVGDVALVEVVEVGQHSRLSTLPDAKQRLYRGDLLVGVFGNRYATDAYEAEVRTTDELHILTDAGMIGTVLSRHRDVRPPTTLRFMGFVADEADRQVNLKALHRQGSPPEAGPTNIILIVGTAMNSGKTTVAAKLVKALLWRGVRVAACKLTGSVCQKDQTEMRAAGAQDVRDFSDYGFPSTYLAEPEELLDLFGRMTADAARVRPDLVVMEVADGLLQRETKLLLEHEAIRRRIAGVLLAAPCAASALFALAQLASLDHQVVAVSGRVTNSPLAMRECAAYGHACIKSSVGPGDELAEVVLRHCRVAAS